MVVFVAVANRFFQFSRGQLEAWEGDRDLFFKLLMQLQKSRGVINRLGWWWGCVSQPTNNSSTAVSCLHQLEAQERPKILLFELWQNYCKKESGRHVSL